MLAKSGLWLSIFSADLFWRENKVYIYIFYFFSCGFAQLFISCLACWPFLYYFAHLKHPLQGPGIQGFHNSSCTRQELQRHQQQTGLASCSLLLAGGKKWMGGSMGFRAARGSLGGSRPSCSSCGPQGRELLSQRQGWGSTEVGFCQQVGAACVVTACTAVLPRHGTNSSDTGSSPPPCCPSHKYPPVCIYFCMLSSSDWVPEMQR